MSQNMNRHPIRYHLFILSIWEDGEHLPDGKVIWRFGLEHSQTAQRIGFRQLGELTAYLQMWIEKQGRLENDSSSVVSE